jgi:O-antigen ligase
VRLRAPYALAVALMVLGGAIAGIMGPLPGTSLLSLVQDLIIFAWATAVTNLARRPGVLRLLTVTWAFTSACAAAVLVSGSLLGLSAVTGVVARDGNRALFTFGDPNYAATYWVCSIFLVFATQRPSRRWLRVVAYALLVWALLLTESNGGVLALCVGVALVLVVAARRRHGVMAALALVLTLCAVAGAAFTWVPVSQIQEAARASGQPLLVNSVGRSDGSSSQRSALIQESLRLYETGGLLGYGPGTTKQTLIDRQYAYAKEAHDDYLAALVERGPLGVAGILLLVLTAALRAGRVVRGPPRGWAELPRPVGLVAALAAMALAGTYYEVLHFRYVWLLLALTAAVAGLWPGANRRRPSGSLRTEADR